MADYITAAEAAELLELSVDETLRLIRMGTLPSVKLPTPGGWRVDRATVLEYKATTTRPE